MINYKAIFAAVLVSLAPAASLAGFIDGTNLVNFCRNHPQAASDYLMGLVDGAVLNQSDLGFTRSKICIPDTAYASQVRDVACQYLENHPEVRHLGAADILLGHLSETFPC